MSTPSTPPPAQDLRDRWLPSPDQMAAAREALAQVSDRDRDRFLAIVPLAQPGKDFGLWQSGQEVVAIRGVWLAENVTGPTEHPYRDAQTAAEDAALAWMREHGKTGTVATAVISPDGHAAVFESFVTVPGVEQ